MRISVIVWNGSFREKYQTIHSFANQTLSKDKYDFTWVDYYTVSNEIKTHLDQYPNFRPLSLGRPDTEKWHLGKCINAAVENSIGDLLVIPDGDVIVEPDFLETISKIHQNDQKLVLYHWRYEESEKDHQPENSYNIEHLSKHTMMLYPVNFATCYSIRRENFLAVKGYEEHTCFSGHGMQATEINVRFKNSGLSVKWDKTRKVYHPWHPNSAIASKLNRTRKILRAARIDHDWINPYAGVEQSWIYKSRLHNIDISADEAQCEEYLKHIKGLDLNKYERFLTLIA